MRRFPGVSFAGPSTYSIPSIQLSLSVRGSNHEQDHDQAEALVDRLNTIAGKPSTPYETFHDGRKARAQVGNYHMESGPGGYRLLQIVDANGACVDALHTGFKPAGQFYPAVEAYLQGYMAGYTDCTNQRNFA